MDKQILWGPGMSRLEQATRRLEQAVARLESAARGGDGKSAAPTVRGNHAGAGDTTMLVAARLDDAIARLDRLLDG